MNDEMQRDYLINVMGLSPEEIDNLPKGGASREYDKRRKIAVPMKSITLAAYDDFDHRDIVNYLSNLAAEYADMHWQKYEDYIVEFPVEEDYAPTTKRDMIYTVNRDFLEWCATRGDHQPPTAYP